MALKKFSQAALNNLKLSAVRFPLSVTFALLLALIGVSEIYEMHLFPEARLERLGAILVTGFFWFGAAKLYSEGHNVARAKVMLPAAAFFVVIALYIYFAKYGLSIHNLIISGVAASVTVAPFIGRKTKDADFYAFNYHLWLSFAYAVIFGIVLCAGISVAIVTVQELFSVNINERAYGVIWTLGCIFLAPYYALSGVPNNFAAKGDETMPKGIRFILSYVLVPLGLVYFLILYAYVIKIITQWQLPAGGLSYMICGFGAAGTIIQLAIYPMRSNGGLVSLFHKYFCIVFLPLIAVLFVAIGVRINDYGITESRYAIVLAGVWFTITTIIYLFRHDDYSMKFGPAILAVLFLLSSFGPWGAVSLSERSQVNRLEVLLIKNNMLKDGKFIKPAPDAKIPDKDSITSILYYLTRTEKLGAIAKWFPKDHAINKPYERYDTYRIIDNLGISSNYAVSGNDKYFSYDAERYGKPLSVTGYDIYIPNLNFYSKSYSFEGKNVTASIDDNKISLSFSGSEAIQLDLEPLLKKLEQSANPKADGMMDMEVENSKIKAKLLFTYLSGAKSDEGAKVSSANFDILIKEKK